MLAVDSSFSESSDDEILCSYEMFETEFLGETFGVKQNPRNNNRLTNGPDFDTMDIDRDEDDRDSDDNTDDDDDIDNEVYYDNQDLDPYSIIQEKCESGDVYSMRYARYLIEKEEMRRNKVSVEEGKAHEKLIWTVCADVKETEVPKEKQFNVKCGIYGFNFEEKPIISDGHNYRINFQKLFERLFPGNIDCLLEDLNALLRDRFNNKLPRSSKKVHPISKHEFLTFLGIILIANVENMPGGNLWNYNGRSEGYRDVPNIGNKYMKQYRFKEIKHMVSYLWVDPKKEGHNAWWQIIRVEDLLTENRKQNILSSNIKTLDESMSASRPQTLATGNLPHLSHILRKPEDLGTEFKNLACAQIYVMLCIEICRDKNDPNGKQLVDVYKKKTTACCMRHLKRSFQCQYLRERELASQQTVSQDQQKCHQSTLHNEEATDDVFVGDSLYGLVATALAYTKNGAKCIMQVKTATSRYPRKFLEDRMQSWPAGSHLVLGTTTPCGQTLYAVGYKYSLKKTLCFVFNKGASHTEPGNPYVAKYRDKNGNCRQ